MGDHRADELVQVRAAFGAPLDEFLGRAVDARTQREGPGTTLNEAGAVRRILHRIGEHERLLLFVAQLLHTEEVAQGHREQRRHRRSQITDAVRLAAGGAVLLRGPFLDVLARVHQHRNDGTGLACFSIGRGV